MNSLINLWPAYSTVVIPTAQMGYLDMSQGVGMRHLEGPTNPDGLNLDIHMFVYVYKLQLYMCMYMLGGWMRSWTNCFFSNRDIVFLSKKKSKRCERKPPIISNLK